LLPAGLHDVVHPVHSTSIADHAGDSMDTITAALKSPDGKANTSATSAHFKMVGGTLFDAKGQTIATQQTGLWHGPSALYISIDFESPVGLHFRNAEVQQEEKFGPYSKVRIINGGVWGYDGTPELLAQLDVVMNVWHIVERPAVAMPEFTIS
jgi:hypothetical protein